MCVHLAAKLKAPWGGDRPEITPAMGEGWQAESAREGSVFHAAQLCVDFLSEKLDQMQL